MSKNSILSRNRQTWGHRLNTKIRQNLKSDIETLLNFIYNPYENLSSEDVWRCINDSFIALKQSRKSSTGYLLGILKNKPSLKHNEVLNRIAKQNRIEAFQDRLCSEQEEKTQNQILNQQKISQYKDFFQNNPQAFTNSEKHSILKYLQEGKIILAGAIIEPKLNPQLSNK